jgi:peptidoglycan/LPS O-acetylase OafA/YrhL
MEWWIWKWANRFLHFAIPLFLLVSACLLTRSLLSRGDVKRFAVRRISRSLWPYLIWSVIYVMFRLYIDRNPSDVFHATFTYPYIGEIKGPSLLVNLPIMGRNLLWGKSYYHLYFMSVLLQMSIVLPFVAIAVSRKKWPFWSILVASTVLQFGAFWLQANVLRFFAPASMIIWYVPSVLVGAWIGANWTKWPDTWRQNWPYIGFMAGLSTYAYLYLEYRRFNSLPITSLEYNAWFLVFAVSVSLVLFGLAPAMAKSWGSAIVRRLGQHSLPIFLVHPMVLRGISEPRIAPYIGAAPASAIVCIVLVMTISYVFARTTVWLRLDGLLFGQNLPPAREPKAKPESKDPQGAAEEESARKPEPIGV